MAKKTRLTREQHDDMGRELHEIRHQIQELSVTVSNAYPLSGREAKAGRKLRTTVDRIDEARSILEDALFREHPDTAETSVYYPGHRS